MLRCWIASRAESRSPVEAAGDVVPLLISVEDVAFTTADNTALAEETVEIDLD
jgi:hypothetical protein